MPSLATCRYQRFQPEMGLPVRTTVGAPRWPLNYQIAEHFKLITPKREWLRLERDDYTERYCDMLTALGVDRLHAEMNEIAERHGREPLVFLCFEDLTKTGLWCHRRIFADWWLEKTGELVPEIGATSTAGASTARKTTRAATAVEQPSLITQARLSRANAGR